MPGVCEESRGGEGAGSREKDPRDASTHAQSSWIGPLPSLPTPAGASAFLVVFI